MIISDLMKRLFENADVMVQFWTCPDCVRPRVRWEGDTAICEECGKTSADERTDEAVSG